MVRNLRNGNNLLLLLGLGCWSATDVGEDISGGLVKHNFNFGIPPPPPFSLLTFQEPSDPPDSSSFN